MQSDIITFTQKVKAAMIATNPTGMGGISLPNVPLLLGPGYSPAFWAMINQAVTSGFGVLPRYDLWGYTYTDRPIPQYYIFTFK